MAEQDGENDTDIAFELHGLFSTMEAYLRDMDVLDFGVDEGSERQSLVRTLRTVQCILCAWGAGKADEGLRSNGYPRLGELAERESLNDVCSKCPRESP